MKLELSSLEKAIEQLEESLKFFHSDLAKKDNALKAQFRSASIQAFEYTYELCIKMLRRQLEQIVAAPSEVKEMDFMVMVRAAAQAGLVQEVTRFRNYREMRNLTTHTYDEGRAQEIAASLDAFLQDARFVLKELKNRNAHTD